MSDEKLVSRDGDVLVVSYPEVKMPIPGVPYSGLAVGGLIYTRRLLEGDDVQVEYDKVYAFLKNNAEREAREKVRLWAAEFSPTKPQATSPRPQPTAAATAASTDAAPVTKPGVPPKPGAPPKPAVSR